jgi:ammonium transporter, Amt family
LGIRKHPHKLLTVSQISLNLGKRHLKLFQTVDDCLDVFHTHFVGSLVGGIGTGLFATSKGCAAFGLTNPGGAIDGNGRQVWVQIVSALFVIGWNAVWTSLIMLFIKYVLRIPLRMTDAACEIGDFAVHQEESYTFAYYNRRLLSRRDATAEDLESGIHGIIMGRPIPEDAHHTTGIPGKKDGIEDHISPMDDGSNNSSSNKPETKKEA